MTALGVVDWGTCLKSAGMAKPVLAMTVWPPSAGCAGAAASCCCSACTCYVHRSVCEWVASAIMPMHVAC